MRDEERGLLAAIAERPDNDGDRRVYADWLDDHGQHERAEFVRLQLALARLPDDHPARPALLTRERGLLYRHEHDWALGLRHLVDGWTFRRGFVEEVRLESPPAPPTAERFDEMFAWPFVRRLVSPRHGWRLLAGLVESEGARRLEELCISHTELNPVSLRQLINSPRLERLRRLELVNCGIGPNTVQRLARSEMLSRLEALVLRDNPFAGDAASELVRSPRVRGLRHLDLRRCRLDDDAVMAIASAPLLGGLRALLLSRPGDGAVAALLACPHLRGLRELELSESPGRVDPSVWDRLTDPGFPSLARLGLSDDRMTRSQLFGVLSSPLLPSLRTLELWDVTIPNDDTTWSPASEWPATPLWLSLSGHTTARPVLAELFSDVPALGRVDRLALHSVYDAEGAVLGVMLRSPHLGGLRRLDLSGHDWPPGSFARLIGSALCGRLTGLDLSDCRLSNPDAAEMAEADLPNLTWLSLRGNDIGSAGARALAESPGLRNLRHLDLSNNRIDDEGAIHLAKAEHLASPVVLNVAGNDIGPEGAAALLGAAERAFSRGVSIPELP